MGAIGKEYAVVSSGSILVLDQFMIVEDIVAFQVAGLKLSAKK